MNTTEQQINKRLSDICYFYQRSQSHSFAMSLGKSWNHCIKRCNNYTSECYFLEVIDLNDSPFCVQTSLPENESRGQLFKSSDRILAIGSNGSNLENWLFKRRRKKGF